MLLRRITALVSLLIILSILPTQQGLAQIEPGEAPTPPGLVANTGLAIAPGASGAITPSALHAVDGATAPERIFFTLQSMPQHGTLTRGGAVLTAGDAFTQADIDENQITYTHDGSDSSQDTLQFILSHGPLIQRVSVAGDGTPLESPNGDLLFHLSSNGRNFVFFTYEFVVPMAYNGMNNIYLRDLEDGSTLLVSRGAADSLSNGDSILPKTSLDGRYTIFASSATNLISPTADTSDDYHIYRYDQLTKTMQKVDTFPFNPVGVTVRDAMGISDDGQVVLFQNESDGGLYVYDFNTGVQSLITTFPTTNRSYLSVLSADGRYVATSTGFLYDLQKSESKIIIPPQQGLFGLSGDGRYLAFIGPDELAPGDHNGKEDVLVYDRVENTYELISPPDLELGPDGVNVVAPTISADGRFVAYSAYQSQVLQVYVYDRILKTRRIASITTTDLPGDRSSLTCSLSAQGERLLFFSAATNLDPRAFYRQGYYLRQLLVSDLQTFSITIDQNKYYYLPAIQNGG